MPRWSDARPSTARYVSSARGVQDLSGGVYRLEVALALAGRTLVTPRVGR